MLGKLQVGARPPLPSAIILWTRSLSCSSLWSWSAVQGLHQLLPVSFSLSPSLVTSSAYLHLPVGVSLSHNSVYCDHGKQQYQSTKEHNLILSFLKMTGILNIFENRSVSKISMCVVRVGGLVLTRAPHLFHFCCWKINWLSRGKQGFLTQQLGCPKYRFWLYHWLCQIAR